MQDVFRAADAPAKIQEVHSSSINAADLMADFKHISTMQPVQDSSKPPLEGLASSDHLLAQLMSSSTEVSQPASTSSQKESDDDPSFKSALDELAKLGLNSFYSGPSDKASFAAADQASKTLAKLDPSDTNLRQAYLVGLPTNPNERQALNQVITADQNMANVQRQVESGATDPTNITEELGKAADKQVSLRESFGDTALKNNDTSGAVGAYTSALRIIQQDAFASQDDAAGLYKRLAALGLSKDYVNSGLIGNAEQQTSGTAN